jgi:hypothetical protein
MSPRHSDGSGTPDGRSGQSPLPQHWSAAASWHRWNADRFVAVGRLIGFALVLSGGVALLTEHWHSVEQTWERSAGFVGRWWTVITVVVGAVLIIADMARRHFRHRVARATQRALEDSLRRSLRSDDWVPARQDTQDPEPAKVAPLLYEVRPISWWLIAIAVAIVVLVGGITLVLLLYEANNAPAADRPAMRIDAIKTTLLVSGTTSGVQALLLAARRHWASERQQANAEAIAEARAQEEAARARAADERAQDNENRIRAAARFDAAVEHLTNDKAVIRIGGLHTLAKLARDASISAQTASDIIEAYLQAPHPQGRRPVVGGQTSQPPEWDEQHVKRVAQRILEDLRRVPTDLLQHDDEGSAAAPPNFWERIRRARHETEQTVSPNLGTNADDQDCASGHEAEPTR